MPLLVTHAWPPLPPPPLAPSVKAMPLAVPPLCAAPNSKPPNTAPVPPPPPTLCAISPFDWPRVGPGNAVRRAGHDGAGVRDQCVARVAAAARSLAERECDGSAGRSGHRAANAEGTVATTAADALGEDAHSAVAIGGKISHCS